MQAFMLWTIATAARPEAVLALHSRQIDFQNGLIHLNPPEREQVTKKYRPVVRLPDYSATAPWLSRRTGTPFGRVSTPGLSRGRAGQEPQDRTLASL
jgi:integrase